ncbi:alpha/beta fold hydrolase [Lederbergia galactosidilytica]|uniref:alpha/beta fold hydrolase n=1 Tax=Lederbergia galactosidilytica TaxID=217031 RepID=UPI0007DB1911|nr:alpha/beta fold hydrolase [Lederbergia galactosidilytica]
MKKKYSGIGLFFICILIIGLFISRPKLINEQTHVAASPAVIPTLFLHGYKGSERSFSTMLERMEQQNWGTKTLVCFVHKNGRVSIRGTLPKNVENPFIQVIFENNRAQLSDQTKWLQEIMKQLKERYYIEEINVVGHSMGGLALTNYIQSTENQDGYPKVQNLITIGSPFLGIDQKGYFERNYGKALIDLKPNSQALNKLSHHRTSFPDDIQVLSIAGVVEDPLTGDGLVSLESALANRNLINSDQFTGKVVTSITATHSGLHEIEVVDQLIANFLWENIDE